MVVSQTPLTDLFIASTTTKKNLFIIVEVSFNPLHGSFKLQDNVMSMKTFLPTFKLTPLG